MNQPNICPRGDTNRQLIASLVEESPIMCPKGTLLSVYVIFTYLQMIVHEMHLKKIEIKIRNNKLSLTKAVAR